MSGGFHNKGNSTNGTGLTPSELLLIQTLEAGVLNLAETTAPSATANVGKIYVKSSDSKPYFKNDSGVEIALLGDAQTFDIRLYGAVGDGTTDDTVAIQAAADAAAAAHGILYSPKGYTFISSRITFNSIDTFALDLQGIHKIKSGTTQSIFYITNCSNFYFKELTMDGNVSVVGNTAPLANQVHCVAIYNSFNITIGTLYGYNLPGDLLYLSGVDFLTSNVLYGKANDTGRNCLSIIKGTHMAFKTIISDKVGREDQPGGVDIEPNVNTENVNDIYFDSVDIDTIGTNGFAVANINSAVCTRIYANNIIINTRSSSAGPTGSFGTRFYNCSHCAVGNLRIRSTGFFGTNYHRGLSIDGVTDSEFNVDITDVFTGVYFGYYASSSRITLTGTAHDLLDSCVRIQGLTDSTIDMRLYNPGTGTHLIRKENTNDLSNNLTFSGDWKYVSQGAAPVTVLTAGANLGNTTRWKFDGVDFQDWTGTLLQGADLTSNYTINGCKNFSSSATKVIDYGKVDGGPMLSFDSAKAQFTGPFSVVATNRFYVDSSGNIGIRTATPAYQFDVNTAMSVTDTFHLQGNTNATNTTDTHPVIYATGGAGGAYPYNQFGNLIIQSRPSGANRDIIFYTGATPAITMVVAGTNKVGFGTTAPTAKLHVAQETTGIGTVSNTAGGTTVTGAGTQFLNTFRIGDTITVNGETVAISAIASDTSMTVAAITGANSGVAYTLVGGDRFLSYSNGLVKSRAGTTSSKSVTMGGKIKEFYTDAGNIGTGEDDLYSYTTEASILGVNGDMIEVDVGGGFVSSGTATRQLKLWFGGTAIFDTGALTLSLSSAWNVYAIIVRVSATVVRYSVSLSTQGAALSAYTSCGELTGLTLSNTNVLKITGEAAGVGAATNDIVAKIGAVRWYPVSI